MIKMFKLIILLVLFLKCVSASNDFLIGSTVIHPNSNYTVSFFPLKNTEINNYLIGIRGTGSTKPYETVKSILVLPHTSVDVHFKIDDIKHGNYELYAENHEDNESFFENHMITCREPKVKFHVESLSPYYVPGTIAYFLVSVHDEQGVPVVEDGEVKFYISNSETGVRDEIVDDSAFNFINKDARPAYVITIPIPELVDIGTYLLDVVYKQNSITFPFKVIKHQPNYFSVTVDAYLNRDREIVVDIQTKINSGEIVEGNATISLIYYLRETTEQISNTFIMNVTNFYGKTQVKKATNDLGLFGNYEEIFIYVQVRERYYGHLVSVPFYLFGNEINEFKIQPDRYFNSTVQSGQRISQKFIVKKRDGTPVEDGEAPIIFSYLVDHEGDKMFKNYTLDSGDGTFIISLDVPSSATSVIQYTIDYLGSVYINEFVIKDNSYQFLNARIINSTQVEVKSSEPMDFIAYIMRAHDGSVIRSKTVDCRHHKRRIINLNIEQLPAKTTIQFNYFSRKTNRIISDTIQTGVKNPCKIEFDKTPPRLNSFFYVKANCETKTNLILVRVNEALLRDDNKLTELPLGKQEIAVWYSDIKTLQINKVGEFVGAYVNPVKDTRLVYMYVYLSDQFGFHLAGQPYQTGTPKPFSIVLRTPKMLYLGEICEFYADVYNNHLSDLLIEIELAHPFPLKNSVFVKKNTKKTVSFKVKGVAIGELLIELTGTAADFIEELSEKIQIRGDTFTQKTMKLFDIPVYSANNFTFDHLNIDAEDNFEIVFGKTIIKLLTVTNNFGERKLRKHVSEFESGYNLGYCTYAKKYFSDTLNNEECSLMEFFTFHKKTMSKLNDKGYFVSQYANSNVWLTVAMIGNLRMAEHDIHYFDNEKFTKSMDLIADRFKDPAFIESEPSEMAILKWTTCPKITQKAFVLLSFIESAEDIENYYGFIRSNKEFIVNEMESCANDMIATVLANHVLYRLSENTREKREILNRLWSKSKKNGNGEIWWEVEGGNEKSTKEEQNLINTEITSYALLTYLNTEYENQTFHVLKWLIGKYNEGVPMIYNQALFAAQKLLPQLKTIRFLYTDGSVKKIFNEIDEISISKNFLQDVKLSFNDDVHPRLGLIRYSSTKSSRDIVRNNKVNVSVVWSQSHVIEVCLTNNDKGENTVVVEIYLPSGLYVHKIELDSLKKVFRRNMVEYHDDNHILKLFVHMTNRFCHNVRLTKRFKVEEQRTNLPIVVYDFYNMHSYNLIHYTVSSME